MNVITKKCIRLLTAVLLFCQVSYAYGAPTSTKVSGEVVDEMSEPLIGVSVMPENGKGGVVTDIDGKFEISVTDGCKNLNFSYVGYKPQTVAITANGKLKVKLEPNDQKINEVVVVGYGVTRKKDLTGAISSVGAKDFNGGLVSSPEELINGKIAGVQITSSSGSPSAGSTIRVRGGASLNASNDPLIVLDGIPLESGGISGNDKNFLSLINPNDIETMTVLKDASSTAIYGSRASNGVIIITTKKGSSDNKLRVNFSTTHSIQHKTKTPDMLSYDEFKEVATAAGYGSLLGTTRTDWNDQIYQTAYGTDNNISVNGRFSKSFPFRVSAGYYYQDGILKTDNAQRATASISLSPSFLQDYLKFQINLKGSLNHNRYANSSAIYSATVFNPTIPVYSGNDMYGGYNESLNSAGPDPNAVRNPLGLLEQHYAKSNIGRVIGNIDVDYKFHFLPDLKFHGTFGYDYGRGKGTYYVPKEAAESYTSNGSDYCYGPETQINKLFTFYLNYNKDIKQHHIDLTAGYDYQYWKASTPSYYYYNALHEQTGVENPKDERHTLLSYYARANYSFDSRYIVTATMRRDGTSRFAKDNRWGTFPSVALAWRISQEPWMRDNNVISDLKPRVSFGITGQQDGIGNYNYLPIYNVGTETNAYLIGNTYYNTFTPAAYVSNLKWETTSSWNYGIDFGFLNNRISGSVDYYTRKTKDLLATVPSAAGTNFFKSITTNVGNVSSKGVEIAINAIPIMTKDWTWNVSFNATWQDVKVTNLTLVDNGKVTKTLVGSTVDGKYLQLLTEGEAPYSFYLYHQLYDEETGKPIEGAYADLNGDGTITQEDRYICHSPAADWIFGLSTSVKWKRLTFSTSLRANTGNYLYNATASNNGALETIKYSAEQLNNIASSYLKTGFATRQHYSDYYLENASFLKMDNLSLSYDFGKVYKKLGLRASFMVQNVFTITKYTGVDPEIAGGVDQTFYPRPRTFSVNLGIDF